jgi:predicted nucleic acid-binding protein
VSFLLDTCVLSEEVKPEPNPGVDAWLDSIPAEELYASVVSLTEIRFGILSLEAGKKKALLEDWFWHSVLAIPRMQFLAVDESVAIQASKFLLTSRDGDLADIYIAATAFVHGFTVVTRNVKHFAFSGLSVLNPWRK